MITEAMKARLKKRGYTSAKIAELTPAEAHEILRLEQNDTKPVEKFSAPVEITVFVKSGGPLTKRIRLAADGSLASDGSACVMSRGSARRVQIADVGELATLIDRLQSNEALALGALRSDLP
jgi:hypothetical protein